MLSVVEDFSTPPWHMPVDFADNSDMGEMEEEDDHDEVVFRSETIHA